MTLAGHYLRGVAAVAAGGGLLAAGSPGEIRPAVIWGVITGLVLQAPLGWITLRAVGGAHFMLVWGLGMLIRLASVGITSLMVFPVLGPGAGPMLGAMVGILVALLLVEGLAAMGQYSGEDER